MNKQYFDAVRLERSVMAFLLFFIVVVAAFGIMNTLITVTVQKRREIGIMKAVGATIWQIIGVFLFQGIVVGVFGTLTGLGLGMSADSFSQRIQPVAFQHLAHRDFPAGSLSVLRRFRRKLSRTTSSRICIAAFIICSFAALIPAYFAARVDPVKALRYE